VIHRHHVVAVAALVAAVLVPVGVRAQQRARDEPAEAHGAENVPEGDKNPIRDSIFIFDQSMTTQTAGLENAEQSNVPFYGWWLSLRPRWNFSDHFRVQARFDYYKEFTNSQNTTYRYEDVFGDIWTDAVYSRPLAEEGRWKNTKVSLGARVIWPTSKISMAQGTFLTFGPMVGVRQKFPIRGDDAPWLNSARVGLSATYLYAVTRDTTGATSSLSYPTQDVEGRPLFSGQLTGQTLAQHTLYGIVDTGVQITPKLGLTVDWILINQWHYTPSNTTIQIASGPANATSLRPDNQFTQLGWFLTELEYELIPEVSLGLGYYNLANTVGPNGQANSLFGGGENNFLWSPDARVFFDVTANLDKIFEDATGKYKAKPGQTAEAARAARIRGLAHAP
jgi:hypothetical protein